MQNTFGEFLKEKRKEKSITQKDLAKLLFVTESAVSKWEKDIARPDISLLPKLAEILNVTEHELITASIDKKSREEKVQAKKWRAFSFSWSLFFYIAYAVALIPCFICNLAINKTLSWFWIVFTALLLAFTITNLPKLIKKHKLILLPLFMYAAFVLLLAVCAYYTNGNWFIIPVTAVLFALVIVFVPIYISRYKVFNKIRKFNDFISIAIDFAMLNVLLFIIDIYCFNNGYSTSHWYFNLALPIVIACYLILNLFLSVRFLKLNKLFKTSIILFLINVLYFASSFIKVPRPEVQNEINSIKFYNADFSNWQNGLQLETNIYCIIFLTILFLSILFMIAGLIHHFKKKK